MEPPQEDMSVGKAQSGDWRVLGEKQMEALSWWTGG